MCFYLTHALLFICVIQCLFSGKYYYNLNGDTPRKAFLIQTHFRGVPSNLDAVLSFNKNIYFFKVPID